MKICAHLDCERQARTRSLCTMHYQRMLRARTGEQKIAVRKERDELKEKRVARPPTTHTFPATTPTWIESAACIGEDPEMFFPERTFPAAKQFCLTRCQVLDECLAFAMNAEQGAGSRRFGIYGGKTPKERRRMELDRKVAA